MRPQWPFIWLPSGNSGLFTLLVSLCVAYKIHSYPEPPDALWCSQSLGRPLGRWACQAAVNNLPRGTLPSIFTTRAHSATNNYIQVPVRYADAESRPDCTVTIDLDGHSRNDQFVFVPWDEVRQMAQVVVDSCVDTLSRGGFITYGIGRTFESLIHPTAYDGENAEIPTPAWVWQPDGTVNSVAIPSDPASNEYSKFCGTLINA